MENYQELYSENDSPLLINGFALNNLQLGKAKMDRILLIVIFSPSKSLIANTKGWLMKYCTVKYLIALAFHEIT
jgi:hypothetical protein